MQRRNTEKTYWTERLQNTKLRSRSLPFEESGGNCAYHIFETTLVKRHGKILRYRQEGTFKKHFSLTLTLYYFKLSLPSKKINKYQMLRLNGFLSLVYESEVILKNVRPIEFCYDLKCPRPWFSNYGFLQM